MKLGTPIVLGSYLPTTCNWGFDGLERDDIYLEGRTLYNALLSGLIN